MKITIESEHLNATTTSLLIAERLLDTLRMLDTQEKSKKLVAEVKAQKEPDIFDTDDISDIPAEVIKPKLPPFKPAWLERHIDLDKSKIIRYSNPCSTLHGKCGTKCYQTELWLDIDGEITTCDCEFYELDELKKTLDVYVKQYSQSQIKKAQKREQPSDTPKIHCSRERLNQVADLANQGCSNKQIAERLGLSLASATTYKGDCKKLNMLK